MNRLQTLLTKAIDRGEVPASESDKHLHRKIVSGCWDQSLIISLQLEHQKANPPSFPELLLLLRTEEDRRSAKIDFMKKHLGSTKGAAHVHSVFSMPLFEHETPPATAEKHETSMKLENQAAELRKQVAKLMQLGKEEQKYEQVQHRPAQSETHTKSESLVAYASQRHPMTQTPPRPWFFFKCGGDGQIAAKFTFDPNPGLVRKKNAELKERRDKFWAHQATNNPSLNF